MCLYAEQVTRAERSGRAQHEDAASPVTMDWAIARQAHASVTEPLHR